MEVGKQTMNRGNICISFGFIFLRHYPVTFKGISNSTFYYNSTTVQ